MIYSLDILAFGGTFGAFLFRQLIIDHIKNNNEMYKDEVEGDFEQYIIKMKKNGEWGGLIELVAFSILIGIKIELWADLKDIIILFNYWK